MDPFQAGRLVAEDTLNSRSIGYNDTIAATEEHELHNTIYSHHVPSHDRKGRRKDHDSNDSNSSEDEMAWEPHSNLKNDHRRTSSIQAFGIGRAAPGEGDVSDDDEERYGRPLMVHDNSHLDHHFHHSDPQHQPRSSSFSAMGGAGSGRRRSRALSLNSLDSRTRRIIWWRRAGVNVIYILAWYCFSTLISVYNKWMFSEDHYNFPYPLFVTSIHMLVQWSLASLTLLVFKGLRSPHRPAPHDYASKVVPCGMATGLDIGLSNLSLRTITLSFYTMCKSSSLAFVLLFAFLFKLETPSWRLAGVILIITSGVVLMVSTETQFVLSGMVEVLTASALGGLRWSLTQILLDKEAMGMGNPIATLFWLAPIMGVTLATCSFFWDGWRTVFANEEFFGTIGRTLKTMLTIFFPGVLAFMMNVTEFGLIQRTSVVTLSVAGIFKEVAVIFLSMFIFHDQLTPINVSGLVVTIFGIALYNYLKYDQFTSGEGGHGGHGLKPIHLSPALGFGPVRTTGDDSMAEEEDPMLSSPRANAAARALGTSNVSARPYEDDSNVLFSAPLHSLGDSSSSSSSSRTSIDSNLHKVSRASKQEQHEHGRIENLEARLAEDQQLAELARKERAMAESLEIGFTAAEQREAEDWDLLLGPEGNDGSGRTQLGGPR